MTTYLKRSAIVASSVLAALVAIGCDNQYPDEDVKGTITGTIYYDGDAQSDFVRPFVQVLAFATFPPSGPPHASVGIPEPDFIGGVPYALHYVPGSDYHVLAQLSDYAVNRDLSWPAGAYPDYCALAAAPSVSVVEDMPVSGIDINLFENGGQEDPCGAVFSCTEAKSVCATIIVPKSYSGGAMSLAAAFYRSVPPWGAPDLAPTTTEMPVFDEDNKLRLRLNNVTAVGDYYLYVALYLQSSPIPVAGVDYVGYATEAVTLGGAAQTVGEIELSLAE